MSENTRTATISTTHTQPSVIRAAIAPDNTDEMQTAVSGSQVETTIARETTGGLQATVDDYLVNIGVAVSVATSCTQHSRPITNQSD